MKIRSYAPRVEHYPWPEALIWSAIGAGYVLGLLIFGVWWRQFQELHGW